MTLTKKQRAELFGMFDGRCAYCGSALPERGWHADHVEPIHRKMDMVKKDGDPFASYKYIKTGECYAPQNDHAGNFMPSCPSCNIDKSVFTLEEWRQSLEHKVEVLRANYSAWRHAERFGLVAQIKTEVVFYFESQAAPQSGKQPEGSKG
jgi:hypothetical protein